MHEAPDILTRCESYAQSMFLTPGAKRSADIAAYLAHTADRLSMRAIAREQNRDPATVLRAVRRVEALRDDPLIEAALVAIETDAAPVETIRKLKETRMKLAKSRTSGIKNEISLSRAEALALSRLAEKDAFLFVASGAGQAGVFCAGNGFRKPLSLIERELASKLLAMDWIRTETRSEKAVKYVMTEAGRAALKRRESAGAPEPETGFAEAPTPFTRQHQLAGERSFVSGQTGRIESLQVNLGKSPLGWLARRRDGNGKPLLTPDELEAGERLREDFEIAEIGPKIGQDWSRFLAPVNRNSGPGRTPSEGPLGARERFTKAVETLGPGLSDAAVRICCFHEGLEATERRMGWSARSGKVVLKLALQRLARHYGLSCFAA